MLIQGHMVKLRPMGESKESGDSSPVAAMVAVVLCCAVGIVSWGGYEPSVWVKTKMKLR